MEKTSVSREAYEQFQKQTRASTFMAFDELPPIYRDAWADVVKLVVKRVTEVLKEVGTTGEAVGADQEYSVQEVMAIAAKAVEGLTA